MAGRDGEEPKEGVDFKWVKAEGSNAMVRKFFSKADKEAPKAAPKAKATPKAAPKAAAKAPADSPKPKARQQGRGDGMIESVRRQVEGAFGTGPKMIRSGSKPAAPAAAPSSSKRRDEAGAASPVAKKPSNSRRKDEAGASQMVSFKEWQAMTRGQRQKAGLPVSDFGGQRGFRRFTKGITGEDSVMKRR
jgi:hypothetical protein